jgi:hypothetical protein
MENNLKILVSNENNNHVDYKKFKKVAHKIKELIYKTF